MLSFIQADYENAVEVSKKYSDEIQNLLASETITQNASEFYEIATNATT